MVHPITHRAATTAARALAVPMDLGLVFPPRDGQQRGRGIWAGHGLAAAEFEAFLPRAASANARGAAVYMRVAPPSRDKHPGLVTLARRCGAVECRGIRTTAARPDLESQFPGLDRAPSGG
jgi:hypothetical protein